MVIRKYIECPICGKQYQIKIQVDKNIYLYDWPISLECIDCGENLKYTFGKSGLRPKECKFEPNLSDHPITTIGYSASLPITEDIYLKDLDYLQSMALFSPFMNISHMGYNTIEIESYEVFLQRIQDGLLPYRNVLSLLLPILNKGNVSAFCKKLSILYEQKQIIELSSQKEIFDVYFELVEQTYRNLITVYYEENYYNRFVKPIKGYLDVASIAEVKEIKNKLDESGKISVWYKDEALPYIADMVMNVQKILPVLFFSCVGEQDMCKINRFKIVTISCNEAATLYSNGYETFTHALKVIVGLNNIIENNSIDVFTNPKVGDVDTITKFANLSGGKMLEHLGNYTNIIKYLDGAMNNKVRNASSHGKGGFQYNPISQGVSCYYDDSDKSKHYETSLIEICRMCYLQLLHIIETTLLARKIVEKAK